MSAIAETLDTPRPPRSLVAVDLLLRYSGAILARIRDGDDLAGLARTMILTIFACGAVFGACLGAYRGGLQVLFGAVKLPLVVLLTAAICAPALSAINAGLCRTASLRRDLALVLVALARGSLVLAAMAPVILLGVTLHASYHVLVLLTVGCCAVGGLVGLTLLVRGLADERRGAAAACLALLAVFVMVGAQMSWTLRPYLVRPRTPAAPFVRGVESSFLEAVATSLDSARGFYRREAAPLPGEPSPQPATRRPDDGRGARPGTQGGE
jgi:uncharacterized integral membrane protein